MGLSDRDYVWEDHNPREEGMFCPRCGKQTVVQIEHGWFACVNCALPLPPDQGDALRKRYVEIKARQKMDVLDIVNHVKKRDINTDVTKPPKDDGSIQ